MKKTVLLLSLILAQPASLAQPAPYGSQPTQQQAARRGPPRESVHRNLSQMPGNVPIPVPPDSKFMSGYQTQYDGSRLMTYLRITTANQPAALDDWYKKSLAGYGWALAPNAAGVSGNILPQIVGTKAGITCIVKIGTRAPKAERTVIMISYNDR